MGYKIDNQQDLEMNKLKESLAALGLEIELPDEDNEENNNSEEEEEINE